MKNKTLLSLTLCALCLSACNGAPQMFWPVKGNKPDYTRGTDGPKAEGRAPLDVPPELRGQVSVPMPDKVATEVAVGDVKMSEEEKQAIAGKAISLDARLYDKTAAEVFSAAIDALTSLNLPVESVDSPSGTITTAWVRQASTNASSYANSLMNVFGGGGPLATRYRFILRVFRMKDGKTQLQVRTLAQEYINHHWVFKELKRKVANEVFSAVAERLGVEDSKKGSAEAAPASGATLPASSTTPPAKP